MSPLKTSSELRGLAKIRNDAFGEHVPIRQKFFHMVFIFMTIGALLGTLVNYLIGSSLESILIAGCLALVAPLIAMWGVYIKSNQEVFLQIMIIILNFILLPVLYLTGGGIESGLPAYFVLGIALTLFLTKTNVGYIITALEAIHYLLVIFISNKYPQWLIDIPALEDPGSAAARDFTYGAVLSNIFIIATILGFLTKYSSTSIKGKTSWL